MLDLLEFVFFFFFTRIARVDPEDTASYAHAKGRTAQEDEHKQYDDVYKPPDDVYRPDLDGVYTRLTIIPSIHLLQGTTIWW